MGVLAELQPAKRSSSSTSSSNNGADKTRGLVLGHGTTKIFHSAVATTSSTTSLHEDMSFVDSSSSSRVDPTYPQPPSPPSSNSADLPGSSASVASEDATANRWMPNNPEGGTRIDSWPHHHHPPGFPPPAAAAVVATPGITPPETTTSSVICSAMIKDEAQHHHHHHQADDPSDVPLCAGCRLRIVDKYFLCAVDRKWHSSCLKCSECGVELETQLTCFERNGRILCKEDYLRIYAQRSRQCAKCLMEIQSSDLVMKARHCVFHVECFKCSACDVVLRKGDLFGMVDEVLYCRMHFDQFGGPPPPTGTAGTIPPPHSTTPNSMGEQEGIFPGFPGYPPQSQFEPGWFPPGGEFSPSGISGTGPMPPGGGGDFPYDNNNEPMLKKRRGRKKRKVENFAAINGYMEGSGASGFPPGLDASGQSKTKRARTSFKHHQLRIMKGHFQINQNPDSRELKMLSQKTGLDKKVLQVWFQNARAKWRRVNAQSGSATSSASSGAAPPPPQSGSLGGAPSSSSSSSMSLHPHTHPHHHPHPEDNCDSDSMAP